MNTFAKTSLLPILAFILVSCATTGSKINKQNQVNNLSAIQNISWVLEKIIIAGKSYNPLPKTNRPTIYFKENGIVTGSATVNNYFGKVVVAKGGSLDFGSGFGRTMMSGSKEQMEQEDVFLDTLKRMKQSYHQKGNLYLSTSDNKTVMIFSKIRLPKLNR